VLVEVSLGMLRVCFGVQNLRFLLLVAFAVLRCILCVALYSRVTCPVLLFVSFKGLLHVAFNCSGGSSGVGAVGVGGSSGKKFDCHC
jgi:hypothetical protein